MFMDFTTEAPEMNVPPVWANTAPDNGTVVGTPGEGTWNFASADLGNSWASDDNGWSLNCEFDEEGWNVFTNVLGDFFVTNRPTASSQPRHAPPLTLWEPLMKTIREPGLSARSTRPQQPWTMTDSSLD